MELMYTDFLQFYFSGDKAFNPPHGPYRPPFFCIFRLTRRILFSGFHNPGIHTTGFSNSCPPHIPAQPFLANYHSPEHFPLPDQLANRAPAG